MYYYFKNNKIKVFRFKVDCTINKAYVALTKEQKEFYKTHKTASVQEVRNCQLYVSAPVTGPTLEEVKESAKAELRAYSAATMGRYVTDLQLANAQNSLELIRSGITDTVYSEHKAMETMVKYNTIGKQCRNKYYESVAEIDACADAEAVKNIVVQTKTFYDGISYEGE